MEDTYSYKGWLNSDSFVKRVCAVYGYSLLGTFTLGLVLAAFFIAQY